MYLISIRFLHINNIVGRLLCYDINPIVNVDGAQIVKSIEELCQANVIITMLPATKHVESTLSKENGVFGSARKGSILIDCSTIDPITSKNLFQNQLIFRDQTATKKRKKNSGALQREKYGD